MTPVLKSVNHLNDNHGKSMTPNRTQAPTPLTNFWKRFLQPFSALLCFPIRKSVDPLPRLLPIGKRSLLPLTAVALSSLLEPKPVNAVGIIDPGVVSFEISPISSTVPFEGTVGWSFIVHEPRKVSLLGVYDAGADGLAVATEVGLWQRELFGTNGYLLAAATVPAGTSGTLFGQFRYASIPELTLQPGVEYTLGALYNQPYTSDRYQGYANIDFGANSDPKFASWIEQNSLNFSFQCAWSLALCSKDLAFPYYSGNSGFGGYYGPNIAGVVDTVHEVPGPMPILGVIAAFRFSRKLRRRTRALK